MRLRLIIVLALAAIAGTFADSRLLLAAAEYVKTGEIQIGGPLPARWDYLTADPDGKRLYVSHGTEVVVIDTEKGTVVGRIADTPGVHGIAIAPGGKGFTSNGRENKVSIVDLKTLQTTSKVETGVNPDAILYEPKNKEIYALNHTGKSVTVIDAATGKVAATLPLAGTAETGQADPSLGRVFVNIEDKSSIDVIDVTKHAVVANWPVAPADEPTGMAIDTTNHMLFVGGGPALVMIDAKTGKVVANVKICDGTDATSYDPSSKLVFVSCSDGKVTIAHVDAPDKLSVVQTLATSRGSRTMTIDTATHRIYLAASSPLPADPNAPAPAPGQRGRGPGADPNSFRVLVYAPK